MKMIKVSYPEKGPKYIFGGIVKMNKKKDSHFVHELVRYYRTLTFGIKIQHWPCLLALYLRVNFLFWSYAFVAAIRSQRQFEVLKAQERQGKGWDGYGR